MEPSKQIQVVCGVRILTENQIQKLSNSAFRDYRRKVIIARDWAHRQLLVYCCGTPCSNVVYVEKATPKQAQDIRTFDWLGNACNREKERRATLPDEPSPKLRYRNQPRHLRVSYHGQATAT